MFTVTQIQGTHLLSTGYIASLRHDVESLGSREAAFLTWPSGETWQVNKPGRVHVSSDQQVRLPPEWEICVLVRSSSGNSLELQEESANVLVIGDLLGSGVQNSVHIGARLHGVCNPQLYACNLLYAPQNGDPLSAAAIEEHLRLFTCQQHLAAYSSTFPITEPILYYLYAEDQTLKGVCILSQLFLGSLQDCIDSLPPTSALRALLIYDGLLTCWQQLAILAQHGLAHRDVHTRNLATRVDILEESSGPLLKVTSSLIDAETLGPVQAQEALSSSWSEGSYLTRAPRPAGPLHPNHLRKLDADWIADFVSSDDVYGAAITVLEACGGRHMLLGLAPQEWIDHTLPGLVKLIERSTTLSPEGFLEQLEALIEGRQEAATLIATCSPLSSSKEMVTACLRHYELDQYRALDPAFLTREAIGRLELAPGMPFPKELVDLLYRALSQERGDRPTAEMFAIWMREHLGEVLQHLLP